MSGAPIPAQPQTLQNFFTVFTLYINECNAAARYAAFANEADEGGLRKVGSLFRAISRSQQIHSANHSATMLKMGFSCQPEIETFEVKTTVENLQSALAAGSFKVNELIPRLIRHVDAQDLSEASRTLSYAMATARSHVNLISTILEQIENQGSNTNLAEELTHAGGYYVCTTCGFTDDKTGLNTCDVCGQSHHDRELVE